MCQRKVQKSPGESRQGTERSPGRTYLPIPVCRLQRSVVMRSGVDMAEEPYSNTLLCRRRTDTSVVLLLLLSATMGVVSLACVAVCLRMHIVLLVERSWIVIMVHSNEGQHQFAIGATGWTAKKTKKTNEISRRMRIFAPSPSVTFILHAARAHRSFLHLQFKSPSTPHPVLYNPPGFLCGFLPTTLQTRIVSRTAPRIVYTWQTTLTTVVPIDL